MADITELLQQWHGGNSGAFDELVPRIYQELRAIAANLLRGERQGHLLDTGALVHEAYLRLVDQTRMSWHDRGHFFAAAATAMRRVLVDQARRRLAGKRGGGAFHEDLEQAVTLAVEPELDVLDVHDALVDLAAFDADLARLVELRYFAGLTLEETAEVMQVSPQTVSRDWTVARAWLSRRLSAAGPPAAPGDAR